jgi:integrase
MEQNAMPKRILPLTDSEVRSAKPGVRRGEELNKDYKLSDGGGLFLLVTLSGGKLWRLDYSYGGKRKTLSLGSYPELSLSNARDCRSSAKKQLTNNIDPGEVKRAQKEAHTEQTETFEVIAREWHRKYTPSWSSSHAKTTIERIERDVFKPLGARPIGEITATELLEVLQLIEERGALETAHRVRTICGQVLRYAVATGRADRDVASDLKGALPPYKQSHLASITDPKKVAELLRAIEGYQGSFIVKCALQFAPLTFVRPGELRLAQWVEFDLDNAEWNIPAERMKMREPHLVPLSSQAVKTLLSLNRLTGDGIYLFPSTRSITRAMSNNTVNAALRRMGFEKDEMTGHGFRAMARTILDEVLKVRVDIIEHQLAHAVRDPNGRAYNRTSFKDERKEMMQTWADYLDGLKADKQKGGGK